MEISEVAFTKPSERLLSFLKASIFCGLINNGYKSIVTILFLGDIAMKTTKKKMTVLAIVIVIASILLLPNWQQDTAAKEEEDDGCQIQGTWYGHNNLGFFSFMVTFHGSNASKGTFVMEFFNYDPTHSGTFPDAVSFSNGHGLWVRTGLNTFDFTNMMYSLDAADGIVFIGRDSGTITLVDCDNAQTEGNLEILTPDMDPIEDGRLCYPPPDPMMTTTFWRLPLEQPCEE